MAANVLPDAQLDYIEWLLVPAVDRVPGTHKAWGAAQDPPIADRTLRHWRTQSPAFVREWNRRIAEEASAPEKMQVVLDKLFAKIEAGEATGAEHKLYLDRIELMNPSPKVNPDEAAMEELTDERLMEAVIDAASLNGWHVKVFDGEGNEVTLG